MEKLTHDTKGHSYIMSCKLHGPKKLLSPEPEVNIWISIFFMTVQIIEMSLNNLEGLGKNCAHKLFYRNNDWIELHGFAILYTQKSIRKCFVPGKDHPSIIKDHMSIFPSPFPVFANYHHIQDNVKMVPLIFLYPMIYQIRFAPADVSSVSAFPGQK